jgi:hypothetical protein
MHAPQQATHRPQQKKRHIYHSHLKRKMHNHEGASQTSHRKKRGREREIEETVILSAAQSL